jgi:hypothetical protein
MVSTAEHKRTAQAKICVWFIKLQLYSAEITQKELLFVPKRDFIT